MIQNVRSGVTGNQNSNFKEIFVIAKNKLNQAVPLSMKVRLIYEHDLNELFFIGRLYNQELYQNFYAKIKLLEFLLLLILIWKFVMY